MMTEKLITEKTEMRTLPVPRPLSSSCHILTSTNQCILSPRPDLERQSSPDKSFLYLPADFTDLELCMEILITFKFTNLASSWIRFVLENKRLAQQTPQQALLSFIRAFMIRISYRALPPQPGALTGDKLLASLRQLKEIFTYYLFLRWS